MDVGLIKILYGMMKCYINYEYKLLVIFFIHNLHIVIIQKLKLL